MGAVALKKPETGDTHISEPRAAGGAAGEGAPVCAPGEIVGNYEILQLVGRGGMGEVYLARHVRLERQVALKILRQIHAGDPVLTERFFHEARTVNAINHEHIVEVHDFVEDRSPSGAPRVYLVMELLKGRSLAELLDAGPVRLRRALEILRQVCDALQAAHAVGVIHRDIKPDNIFLTQRGGPRDFVKVLDFGVAKLDRSTGPATPATIEGMVVGTPAYMAPEQASALGIDGRSDVYSVGTMLYEVIAGRVPFDGPSFLQVAMAVVSEPPPPLPDRTPAGERVPERLAALTMACLDKDPGRRPQSAAELGAALESALADLGPDPAEHEPAPLREPAVSAVRARKKRWPYLAGAAAVAVAGALAALSFTARRTPPARPPAVAAPVKTHTPPPVEEPAPPEHPAQAPVAAPEGGIDRDAVLDPYGD